MGYPGQSEIFFKDKIASREKFSIDVDYFSVWDCIFEDCDFSLLRAKQAVMGLGPKPSVFKHCKFDKLRVNHFRGKANFIDCSFRNGRIKNWWLEGDLVDCVFSGRISTAVIVGRPRTESRANPQSHFQIVGNNFRETRLENFDFRLGVDLERQKLPMGEDYIWNSDAAEAINNAEEKIANWNDDKEKSDALVRLKIKRQNLEAGQKQLFMCRGRQDTDSLWLKLKEALMG